MSLIAFHHAVKNTSWLSIRICMHMNFARCIYNRSILLSTTYYCTNLGVCLYPAWCMRDLFRWMIIWFHEHGGRWRRCVGSGDTGRWRRRTADAMETTCSRRDGDDVRLTDWRTRGAVGCSRIATIMLFMYKLICSYCNGTAVRCYVLQPSCCFNYIDMLVLGDGQQVL